MASSMIFGGAIVAMLCFCWQHVRGEQLTVGGASGWMEPTKGNLSYSDWALQHRFYVGDSLVFNYAQDTHSVLQVNRQDFDTCHTENSLVEYKDGASVVHLTKSGPHWFICGLSSHCNQGQKFGIMVAERKASHRPHAPSPSPSASTSRIVPPTAGAAAESPGSSPMFSPAVPPQSGAVSFRVSRHSALVFAVGLAGFAFL